MSATQTLLTAEQFAKMQTAETEDFELVEGELVPVPSGTPAHSRRRDNILTDLKIYLRRHPVAEALAETDCRLSPESLRRPDISVFLKAKQQQVEGDVVPIPFAPDIAVEVLSPSESAVDVNRKVLEYLGAGSKEVWVVDSDNGEVFVSTSDGIRVVRRGEVLKTPLLPEFELPVSSLDGPQ